MRFCVFIVEQNWFAKNTECSRDVTLWRLPNRRVDRGMVLYMNVFCGCIQRRHNVTSLLIKQICLSCRRDKHYVGAGITPDYKSGVTKKLTNVETQINADFRGK